MSQNQNSNLDLLEVKVHPHLVGAVQKTTDKSGKVRVIPSTLVNMYDTPCKPENATPMTGNQAYDAICDRIAAIGLFSSRFVNVDELTRINYSDDCENLLSSEILGCETVELYYPHNRLTYHTCNEWLFDCFQIQFYFEKEIFSYQNLNLPTVVNIKRSSGKIQKAILHDQDFIRLRKSSRDIDAQVYLKVYFSVDNPEETQSEECIYNKMIYLKDLVELNPKFKQLQVKIPHYMLTHISKEEPLREYVVNKIKGNYFNWIENNLLPKLKNIKGLEIISN
jgi:hypothetical protein